MANKVLFGLKNVHYAVMSESATAAPSWGTPKAIKGAVNLTLSPEGGANNFYADNIAYFRSEYNNGYSGSLEVAKFPETFLADIFGDVQNTDKVAFESATVEAKPFALLFQIDGDSENDLYAMYRCYATRPQVSASTIGEGGKEVQTQTCDITILPVYDPAGGAMDGVVRAKTTAETTSTVRSAWFTTVQTKS